MDNYGKVIAKLRKANGFTQEELGKALNVTYQAVSKWENNLSRPDLDTITQMCRLFNITLDEFINLVNMTSGYGDKKAETTEQAIAPAQAQTQPTVEKETTSQEAKTEDPAPSIAEEAATSVATQPAEMQKPTKSTQLHAGFLIGIIVAVVLWLGTFLSIGILLQKDIGNVSYAIGAVLGYFLFSFVCLLGHDALPAELFFDCVFKSINVPGVIFTLDLDGILFLLFYKCILAPIVSAIVWLFFVIGGFLLSLLMSAFMFPFYIPRVFRETFRGGRTRPKKIRKLKFKNA